MRIRYLCVFALFSTVTLGQNVPVNQKTKGDPIEPESKTAAPLPVEKVILYKNGVGYFEHIGRVSGNQDLGIDFTTSQLNDVLKSLTLVDLSGGRISDVRYNSVAPLDQQLKSLQIPLGEDVNSASFLTALRGTRVEVRSGKAAATGKLFKRVFTIGAFRVEHGNSGRQFFAGQVVVADYIIDAFCIRVSNFVD